MTEENKLNNKTKIYLFFITTVSVILFIFVGRGQSIGLSSMIYWICLSIIAESFMIMLPAKVGVSVGFAISIAEILVIGPFQAAICDAIGVAIKVDIGKKKIKHIFNTKVYKTIFNSAQVFISTIVSGYIYEALGGKFGVVLFPQSIALVFIYIILGSCLISALMFTLLDKNKFYVWLSTLIEVTIISTLVGSVGILMALVSIKIGNMAVLLFFGPLLIARYSYKQYNEMKVTYMETINAFNKALEAKDTYTSGHSLRVQQYSEKLGEAMGLTPKRIDNIKNAAVLHDIGKIGVDDSILRKPGKLTKEEFDMIKKHPEIGSDILKDVDFLRDAAKIIRSHHERYDGNGYPDGIRGDEIPVESIILSIADVYDAMTSDRPYRGALSKEEALAEIKRNAGIQFSPAIANKFIEIMSEEQ